MKTFVPTKNINLFVHPLFTFKFYLLITKNRCYWLPKKEIFISYLLSCMICIVYMYSRNCFCFLFQYCQSQGGNLVEMNSQEESEIISANRDLLGITNSFWLGLNRISDNWVWMSSDPYIGQIGLKVNLIKILIVLMLKLHLSNGMILIALALSTHYVKLN